jgi:hypothetical protein
MASGGMSILRTRRLICSGEVLDTLPDEIADLFLVNYFNVLYV